ncbi:MAG: hypothetical protein QXL82_03215 [Candidatus Aenigmatarchaeota archaeon]
MWLYIIGYINRGIFYSTNPMMTSIRFPIMRCSNACPMMSRSNIKLINDTNIID